jgi:hypothetical protein
MDVLMNWLEQRDSYKKDRQAIQDAFNAQNKCGEYLGVKFAESQEDINKQLCSTTIEARMESTSIDQPR